MKTVAKEKCFTEEELAQVRTYPIPEHIAIIMDGNRRWAKKEGLPAMAGHWKGAETLQSIVSAAAEVGVKILTVYAFSTENWNRPRVEIKTLLHLFKTFLLRQKMGMVEEGVRMSVIGDLSRFPKDLQKIVSEVTEATKEGKKLELVIALNYGGRDEIKRAVQAIAADCASGKISAEEISETLIARYLDTANWKDPDLLIRTSGESRISNFLLWQISYSEVVVSDVLWPNFCEKDLLRAILEYQNRDLRLGK